MRFEVLYRAVSGVFTKILGGSETVTDESLYLLCSKVCCREGGGLLYDPRGSGEQGGEIRFDPVERGSNLAFPRSL